MSIDLNTSYEKDRIFSLLQRNHRSVFGAVRFCPSQFCFPIHCADIDHGLVVNIGENMSEANDYVGTVMHVG
jgi:hypothetical protein